MTDQPTKGQFHLHRVGDLVCVTTKENSHLDLKEIVNLRWILAAFHGPDREANARKFMLVDELVEALQGMISWAEDRPEKHPVDTWADACAILAKIKGGER